MEVTVLQTSYGIFKGKQVQKYCIAEKNGIAVSVINYGAAITNIIVPDNENNLVDVVLGFENIEGYILAGNVYMGCICGRFANRIANGKFTLNETQYILPQNNAGHTLHGGMKSFDKVYWDAHILPSNDGVTFNYTSVDGEEGFLGNVNVSVTYRVTNATLQIEYKADTDKPTPINLTNHCYFNLSGTKEKDILNHLLQINANEIVEVSNQNIPTGKLIPVKNTAFNFLEQKKVGENIDEVNGYDHCWVVNKITNKLVEAVTVKSTATNIQMKVYTTQPGLQLYCANFLDGTLTNTKQNNIYNQHAGLCLEAQHFPDSPNHPHFPTTILQPEDVYYQKTLYSFTTL